MALPLQQSPAFAAALKSYGATVTSTAPVVLQRRIGPLGRIDFASRVWAHRLTHRPRIVNAEANTPNAFRKMGYVRILTPVHIAEWSLKGDLRAGMSGKWRNALHKGLSQDLTIQITKWDGSPHWLFPQAEAMARSRKFRALPTALLAAFAKASPNDALIFEAHDTAPLAACLILRHGATATYQTAWASAEGLAKQAPRVLLDTAARHLQTLGHDTLDLGPVETDHNRGLARFKLGTGARARRLGGTWLRWR